MKRWPKGAAWGHGLPGSYEVVSAPYRRESGSIAVDVFSRGRLTWWDRDLLLTCDDRLSPLARELLALPPETP